jgi:hypothetical protein
MVTPPAHAGLARRVAIGGVLAEVVAAQVMEQRLGELAEPYHDSHSQPGRFAKLAKAFGLGGAAVLAVAGRRRPFAVLGGAAVVAASFCERWSVYSAGTASADDPRYTVAPQRKRRDAAALQEVS